MRSTGRMLDSEWLAGISIVRFSSEVIIPVDTIRKFIDGDIPITREMDARICKYLGLTRGYFMRYEAEYQKQRGK